MLWISTTQEVLEAELEDKCHLITILCISFIQVEGRGHQFQSNTHLRSCFDVIIHKSCLVLSNYWCEANKDPIWLARFAWYGLGCGQWQTSAILMPRRDLCAPLLSSIYIYTLRSPSDGGNLARAPALLSPLAPAPTQLSESQLSRISFSVAGTAVYKDGRVAQILRRYGIIFSDNINERTENKLQTKLWCKQMSRHQSHNEKFEKIRIILLSSRKKS